MYKILVISYLLSISLQLNASSAYENWLKQENSKYNNYKKSMDEEFLAMLKKDWESFKLMSTPNPYKKPKPKILPVIKKEIVVPKKEIVKSPKVKVKPIVKKEIIKQPKIKKLKLKNNFQMVKFNFYNQQVSIQYDKKSIFNTSSISKKAIVKYWDTISTSDYKYLLLQINKYEKNLSLNDWAKYQFVHKLGSEIYQDENIANLFTWFILVKMNFNTKVGYSNSKVYLLSTIKHNLFQVSFLTLKDKKYYILTPNGKTKSVGAMYTFAGNYPKATEQLSFDIDVPINLNNDIKSRDLTFKYSGKNYSVKAKYSAELVNFYKSFPQSDYAIYFDTKNSSVLSNSLLSQLKTIVDGKSEIEAVNTLLRFVQTSFKYKTDPQQFNYEKVMFPEETIFYPYSDCEDRSILFSYLVTNLLNLEVVGLKFHDHLATAVAFSSTISGDNFSHNGKTFTIADPTYINANAGMRMPIYKNSKFDIIDIHK